MSHILCFTDLSLKTSCNLKKFSVATDADSTPSSAQTAGKGRHQSTTFFVRDEDKKSSFALERPVSLVYESSHERRDDRNAHTSKPRSAAGDDNADEEREHSNHESQLSEEGSPDARGEKFTLSAAASITSCISYENNDRLSQEIFLFGGFELITNVRTVEVHAVRSTDASTAALEAYITTCKGVPMRDLNSLSVNPLCIDGSSAEARCKEIKNVLDDNSAEPEIFYKFIFVLPGGPKPMERVRLKFARIDVSPVHGLIIVRTLKVKGRLSDSMPIKISENQSTPPVGSANFFPDIVEGKNGLSGIASMMAMMGVKSAIGTSSMDMNMNQQRHQMRQIQLQSLNPQNLQHQPNNNNQQEKKQAEIMSSIAGLGMFLRSSEDRIVSKFDMMLIGMEMRISKRLDCLDARLDAIEQNMFHKLSDDDENNQTNVI
ncbi:hypothetical protein ACHAXA_007901 [Cyclostephanos tholiformis]|jgi:hypothetical protein|uniref:Uncharacterized protein n=1 Tax=Cyclostephanos tholiformis TaxID=382380 RepID=A0ABD3SHV4_9STRA